MKRSCVGGVVYQSIDPFRPGAVGAAIDFAFTLDPMTEVTERTLREVVVQFALTESDFHAFGNSFDSDEARNAVEFDWNEICGTKAPWTKSTTTASSNTSMT